MKKISFLMPAHNEEKIIRKALDNLLVLPYSNFEVLIGLDGCTDKTSEIVREYAKKSKKFKYFTLNIRKGKPAVINELIKHTKGDIIIIHDADWIFRVENKKSMYKFLRYFDDTKVGGIAESFPVEWDNKKIVNGNFWYKMVAYSTYYWMAFQKDNLTFIDKNKVMKAKIPKMFLTNIILRKLYHNNTSLGDDFERTKHVMDKGYDIVVYNDLSLPRMVATYETIRIKDIFQQKIRTALARSQLEKNKVMNVGLTSYYLPAIFYMLKKAWKKDISTGLIISLWIIITALATLIATFKSKDTKKGWMLRAKR